MKMKLLLTCGLMACMPLIGLAQTEGGKSKTKVKRDNGEVKMKTEDATGKTKVQIDRDGTTRMTTDKAGMGKKTVITAPPAWAKVHNYNNDRAVYFPDYYMFYHPGRGYVYWNEGAWQITEAAPEVYSSVDWNGARVHVLEDVDLDVYPETTWVRYREMYPSRPVTIDVLVPEVQ